MSPRNIISLGEWKDRSSGATYRAEVLMDKLDNGLQRVFHRADRTKNGVATSLRGALRVTRTPPATTKKEG